MKTSDLALLGVLGLGGYYLVSKGKDSQQVLPGVGVSSPINLDLSGLFGGLGGLGSGASQGAQGIFDAANEQAGGILGTANAQAEAILDSANMPAGGILDAARGVSDGFNAAKGVVEGAGGTIGLFGGGGSATPFSPLGGKDIDWAAVKGRGAGDLMSVGAAWLGKLTIPMAIRALGPKVAMSVGGKLAVAGTGIGVPLAIAWTGADILTTAYEIITGKDIPVLGFGELWHVSQQEKNTGSDSSKGQIPEKAIAQKETKPSPTRESPTRAEMFYRLPSYEERFGEKPIADYGLVEHALPPTPKFTNTYTRADYNADIALLNKNLTTDQKRILGLN